MAGHVPPLTLGWRLKMALGERTADWIGQQLGVSRNTVSRWMNDRGAEPRRAYVLQWAMATGVNAQWLEKGEAPRPDGPEGAPQQRVRRQGLEPRTQWFRASRLLATAA